MKSKYHKNTSTNSEHIYQVLDEDRNILDIGWMTSACWSGITYRRSPENARWVRNEKRLTMVPYDKIAIIRFFNDLAEIGFPADEVRFEDGKLIYLHDLKRCKTKQNLLSHLALTRCLWEDKISHIADCYFQQMDENPHAGKYETLVYCHLTVGSGDFYLNTNHMVTYSGSHQRTVPIKRLKELLIEKGSKFSDESLGTTNSKIWGGYFL